MNAWAIGTAAAVAVIAVVLLVGYGRAQSTDAWYITGIVAVLLVLPLGVSAVGRALALRWSARVTAVEALLWLLASLIIWWWVPVLLDPAGGASVLGLALAAVPVSIQIVVARWWLARTSGPRRGRGQRRAAS